MFTVLAGLLSLSVLCQASDTSSDNTADSLTMSDPIACKSIKGFDDYEPLENATIGPDEKLLIYTRVNGHTVKPAKNDKYQVHLIQDVNVRKKGQKRVIWGRKKIIDFMGESIDPSERIYLGTTIGIKGIAPGEYQAELILTDAFDTDHTTRQVLDFKVKRN